MDNGFRSTVLDVDSDFPLIIGFTTGILFLGGLATVYESVLRGVLHDTFILSPVKWVVFSVGAFLVEPLLLFGVLYYLGSRSDVTVSFPTILAGLIGAVVVGTLLGQYVGIRVWGSAVYAFDEIPLTQAQDGLFALEPTILGYWRVLVEPLVRDLLTAIAALSLARTFN